MEMVRSQKGNHTKDFTHRGWKNKSSQQTFDVMQESMPTKNVLNDQCKIGLKYMRQTTSKNPVKNSCLSLRIVQPT